MVRTTVGHFPGSDFLVILQCVYISELPGKKGYSHMLSFLSATRAYTLTLGTPFLVEQDVHNEGRAGRSITRPKTVQAHCYFFFIVVAVPFQQFYIRPQIIATNSLHGIEDSLIAENKQQVKRNLHTWHTLRISCRAPPQRCVLATWKVRKKTSHIL